MPDLFKPLMLAAACCVIAAPTVEARTAQAGQEELAKMLEGRTKGDPQKCITTNGSSNLQIIDKTAIVYQQGRTLWVNRTRAPDRLDDDDILLIKRWNGDELCRMDDVNLLDRTGGFFKGFVVLEEFVPYTLHDPDKS